MIAIRTEKLSRTFGVGDKAINALTSVSLSIEEGEVHGLLGPNGAGKTTLVKLLSTVLLPSAGTASIFGHDVVKNASSVRPLIGIVFGGDRGLYNQLTARETLEYWAALYNVSIGDTKKRVPFLLERVGLIERSDERVETYSRGMRQRLHLARGLISNARVLFLDEPTIGMDPIAAKDFRLLVKDLKSEGRTILLTTHDMAEAEALCDRVALIDKGQLLAVETPRTLAQLVSTHERIDFDAADSGLSHTIRQQPGVSSVTKFPDTLTFRVELSDAQSAGSILQFLVSSGITSIRTSRPSLEEVYVHMIGDRGLKI